MNKHLYWSLAIKNSICVICRTALAVIFNKWWIALFAALFMSGFTTSIGNYRICDKCGKHSPYADSRNEALEKAKEAGWVSMKNGDKWEDYCPECQN